MKFLNKAYFILLPIILLVAVKAGASEPQRGYRGFVDLNAEALFEKKYTNDRDIVYSTEGIITTHGFQFNRHFFLGGGAGLGTTTSNFDNFHLRIVCPIFAVARADWKVGRVPLFADVRLGSFLDLSGYTPDRLYINPSVGYHCSWGAKIALNFAVGVSWHTLDDYIGHRSKFMPSVKIGIEFH